MIRWNVKHAVPDTAATVPPALATAHNLQRLLLHRSARKASTTHQITVDCAEQHPKDVFKKLTLLEQKQNARLQQRCAALIAPYAFGIICGTLATRTDG